MSQFACRSSCWTKLGVVLAAVVGLVFACGSHDGLAAERAISFPNDVVPVLTKAGCNIGVCHAKAGGGQNGFQLSVLGFEPRDDYDRPAVYAARRQGAQIDYEDGLQRSDPPPAACPCAGI